MTVSESIKPCDRLLRQREHILEAWLSVSQQHIYHSEQLGYDFLRDELLAFLDRLYTVLSNPATALQ